MNKQDIISAINNSGNISKTDADVVVNGVFALIEDALARGEEVKISGFGTFKRMATKARTCYNPRNGEAIEVPAGHKIKFKASSKLKV